MVLNNLNKNDSILLEIFASVFTVSSNFTDNPRRYMEYPGAKACSAERDIEKDGNVLGSKQDAF